MATKRDITASLSINGEDFGDFDAFTGGGYDADETKYTPFDGVQRTYLGNPTEANLVLTRDYRPVRDGPILRRKARLQDQPGIAVVQDRGGDGNWQQNRPPYSGLIKAITGPEGDSNSGDIAMLSIEMSTGVTGR